MDAYLACGGNYIETARNYGKGASEEKIGRALEGRRDRVILSSKTGATTTTASATASISSAISAADRRRQPTS